MKDKTMRTVLVGMIVIAAAAASAGVVATESFDSYSPGAFANGSSGGTGWAAGWIIPGTVAPTIEVGGLSYSSGAVSINGGTHRLRQDVASDISGAAFPAMRALGTVQTGTLYMSMLVRPISTEDNDFYQFGLAEGAGEPYGSVVIDHLSNTDYRVRAGNSLDGLNGSLGVALTNNDTVLLVVKVHKISSNYTVTACANPTSLTEGANTWVTAGAKAGYDQISHWAFRSARIETTDEIDIDEIKIATTFAEVVTGSAAGGDLVPEPAGLGLVGLALVLKRRRN
jgi:hypothetical protein